MKLLRNLLYVSLMVIAIVNTGCKKDPEPANNTNVVAANFQGVFSEEIGVVELGASSSGVQAKVNINGEVIDFASSQVLENGKSVTIENQNAQITVASDANEVLTIGLTTEDNTYTVVGFKSGQTEKYMGVVDENVNGAMQLGRFNFIVDGEVCKGLIYFEGVDAEPVLFEGAVLNSSETQMDLEIERNGATEQVVVELMESFGKTHSSGLNVSAVPVTISTSNVGPASNSGVLHIGNTNMFLPPIDTIEITQAKLTSITPYFDDSTGRFHKLSFASANTQWGTGSFFGQGAYFFLVFSTSLNQIGNIEAVYPAWNWSSSGSVSKLLVADYELDEMYVQENLAKANDFFYESISVENLNISRNGLIYTVSAELYFGYPEDALGNPIGNPGRLAHFNYIGTIDLY